MPTGLDNDVFAKRLFYIENIYKNIGKAAKIQLLVILAPLNGVFGGNFPPYPQEGDIKDILGQNWKFKIFEPFRGRTLKGQKMTNFGHF